MSLSPSSLLLAIDQGGQSTRVAVYRSTGEQLCCYSADCATQINSGPQHYFIEQNGEEILRGIREALEKVQRFLGEDIRLIGAAGFAGQGSSLLCWKRQTGEPLTPVLSWQDTRGEPYLQHFPLSHAQVQELTGLRISPHYGASKMRWCLDHYPQVAEALSQGNLSMGPIVSYIFYHLLRGRSSVDPGHAQRTLLWNLTDRDWDKSLLQLMQIPRSVLPQCLHHNSFFGNLALGDFTIPFAASARDQGASLFARGLPDRNACYINIGTGAFIQRVSDNLRAPEGLLVSPLWLPEQFEETRLYAWEATVNGAAAALQYLQQQTGWALTPDDINRALSVEPTKSCYMLNAIGGLSAPYWRTDLQTEFSSDLSAEEKILAWLESVVFQIIVNVQLLAELGQPHKIYISGGLSNADLLCQKIADLSHIPVYRSDNSDATLQGIACMAAGLPAYWSPESADEMFTPQQNAAIAARFHHWREKMMEWLQ